MHWAPYQTKTSSLRHPHLTQDNGIGDTSPTPFFSSLGCHPCSSSPHPLKSSLSASQQAPQSPSLGLKWGDSRSHPPGSSDSFADRPQSQVNTGPQIWSQTFLYTLGEVRRRREWLVSVVFRPLMKLRESPLSTGCSIYNKEWLEMDVSFVPMSLT